MNDKSGKMYGMMEEKAVEKETFMQETMDYRRLWMCFLKKWWIPVVMTIIGAVLGCAGYLVVRTVNMTVEYEAVSKVYVRFIYNPNGDVEQYYNGYTWNDLMATDPILNRTMEQLSGSGIERQEVIDATTAAILSDLRLLTLTFNTEDEMKTSQIQQATQAGLLAYGMENEEITDIEVISTTPPVKKEWDDKMVTAGIGGGALFFIITVFILWLYLIVDDSFYVTSDIQKRYKFPAFGMLIRMPLSDAVKQPYEGEIKANMEYLMKDYERITILNPVDSESPDGVVTWLEELHQKDGKSLASKQQSLEIKGMGWDEDVSSLCETLREEDGVVIAIPFGRRIGKQVERVVNILAQQDCKIAGMLLTEGDEGFWRFYYGRKKR